ncbi:MAG: hypothetical protein JNL60_00785 [Bacteroidia bacterium]|nr:hypothetical protein [Bacteroidia bacterium]
MKTIIVLSQLFFFVFNSISGDLVQPPTDQRERYCAKMLDGRLVVMRDGAIMVTEVRFANGTELKPDGSITNRDGSRSFLKNGECLDRNGAKDSDIKDSKPQTETPNK